MNYVDFDPLKGAMIDKYSSVNNFCKNTGYSLSTIVRKLNGERNFTRDDIVIISDCLNLSPDEILYYFFNDRLDEIKVAI